MTKVTRMEIYSENPVQLKTHLVITYFSFHLASNQRQTQKVLRLSCAPQNTSHLQPRPRLRPILLLLLPYLAHWTFNNIITK